MSPVKVSELPNPPLRWKATPNRQEARESPRCLLYYGQPRPHPAPTKQKCLTKIRRGGGARTPKPNKSTTMAHQLELFCWTRSREHFEDMDTATGGRGVGRTDLMGT